jgi:hypothetical protein
MIKGCKMVIIYSKVMCSKNCAKIVDLGKVVDVVVTLVLLEKKFPPVFFDTMTHLLVHLIE